jgi:hypothetical protein
MAESARCKQWLCWGPAELTTKSPAEKAKKSPKEKAITFSINFL